MLRPDSTMKAARLFLLSCAFVLGGCALKTPLIPEHPLPSDWKNAAGFPVASSSRDLSRWWGEFSDPTLNRLISDAVRNSPDIATASSRIRESRAIRKATASSLFPSLNASAGARSSTTHTDGFGTNSSESYTAGLDASWEIDLFGGRRSDLQAASANLGAVEETYHSVEASIASEIAIAYTNLRAAEARLEVVRRSLKSREETYQLASFRLQAGTIDALEEQQALTSLEQARASIPSLEQTASQARNLISLLSGKTPGSLDPLLNNGKNSIPSPPSSLAIGIPADTLRQRPDLRIAGYQWLSAAASTRSAQADRYPTLNLSGSLGLNTLRASKIFNPETTSADLIAGITAPIFDAGRIRANIEAQTEVQEQALQNYRGVVLTALSEVEDSLIACRRTAERLATLERATDAARQAEELADQRYEAGVIDLLTVLDAQRTLLSLEETLVTVRADRTAAYIQLYKALGGGWSKA